MRRFIVTTFAILTLLVSAAGAAPAAHAQLAAGATCNPEAALPTDDCVSGYYCSNYTKTCVPNSQMPAETVTADKAAAGTAVDLQQSPSLSGPMAQIMSFIMSIFAWLLTAAMITLNYAVYYTVIKMGDYVHGLAAVGVTWRILRDIANIMFIFGFLGAGIATILNVDQYGWKTKMLPMLLVGAIFLNFSLFITEAMIDGTNLFATQFYTQINGGTMPTKDTLINEGISGKIMQQLGLATIYGEARTRPEVLTASNSVFVAFMGIILFIVTAFVMFSLAFILIARFVALIFFIILCPVGFMGLALPGMQYRAGQWWKNFLEQIITAPVLLLLLYVALAVITDAQFLAFGSSPNWLGLVPGTSTPANMAGFAGMLLSFLIAMGLLLMVVIKAKSMSAFGAGMAIKAGGKLSFGATALGASTLFGGSAFLGRKALQRYAPNSRTARVISNYALRPLEKAKFDIRSAGVGKALGAVGIGEVSAPIGASTVGRVKQGIEYLKKTGQEVNREYDQEARMPRLHQVIASNNIGDIGKLVGNMSDKEMESSEMQRLLTNNPSVAASLSQSRFDKLVSSDSLNDAQKNNLRKNREDGLKARYTDTTQYQNPPTHPTAPNAVVPSVRHPGANMSRGEQAVRGLTNEAASQLPDAVLLQPDVHENLSIRQLNAIANAGKIQDATATTIGTFLSADPTFVAYFNGRNRQQQQDINSFWHTNLSLTPGGGAAGGGTPPVNQPAPPPPGYGQNPGGAILTPTNVGRGPRPTP